MRPVASRHRITAFAAVLCAAAAPIALGACSSSGSGSSASAACPATVDATVQAHDTFRFTPSTLHAKAGKFVVKLVDAGSLNHTFQIHGFSGKAVVSSGKTSCATFTLTKGTWNFYCGIPGHEAEGMKGTITVS